MFMQQRTHSRTPATRQGAVVSCAGRWGRRRAHVSQCACVWRAETLYDALLADGSCQPGVRGSASAWIGKQRWVVGFEVRPNPVWRWGRVFFRCPHCTGRCTRLYAPLRDLQPRCRRCWGLSYESQQWNYKGLLWQRFPLYVTTSITREEQQERAVARRSARRIRTVAHPEATGGRGNSSAVAAPLTAGGLARANAISKSSVRTRRKAKVLREA